MTFTPHKSFQTVYRGERGAAISAQPGKVIVHLCLIENLEEMEEVIATIRAAAAEAQLPERKPTN